MCKRAWLFLALIFVLFVIGGLVAAAGISRSEGATETGGNEPHVELVTTKDNVSIYKVTPTTLSPAEQLDAIRRHVGAPAGTTDSFTFTIVGEHPLAGGKRASYAVIETSPKVSIRPLGRSRRAGRSVILPAKVA